jgi:hypothetical protein
MTLEISKDLSLPLQAVTETFALLAKRGAGKSNAAVVMAEQMYDAGLPWVAVDPKGDWWGVRSDQSGTGPGLPVLVLGGQHGDVPLEPTAGTLVADLIAGERLTAVVDVSLMSKADARRFLADFAERLYKANTEPLHVFAEEAHEYIPQRVTAGDARMVGAWEKLVKWGRTHGLGVTLITQRSASLNKDVLTQVETLIALRTTGPQDIAAIRSWVDEHETGKEVLAELRKLPSGDAYVLSPQWLELDDPLRVTFYRRRTFDSGATPKAGQKRTAPRSSAEVDLAALKEAMAETIERAKADDPKELRAQVAQLQRDLAAERAKPTPAAEPELVEVQVLDPAIAGRLEDLLVPLTHELASLGGALAVLRDSKSRFAPGRSTKVTLPSRPIPHGAAPAASAPAPRRAGTRAPAGQGPDDAGDLTKPMRRVLDALAWLEAAGFGEPTKIQTGFIAQYRVSKKGGGNFGNVLSQLRGAGLIDYPSPGSVALTDAGRARATPVDIEPTTAGLQQAINARLAEPERRVLAGIIDAYPDSLTKQDAGALAGYSVSAKGGGNFGNILSRLRSLGLIDYPGPGLVVATDVLFLERV